MVEELGGKKKKGTKSMDSSLVRSSRGEIRSVRRMVAPSSSPIPISRTPTSVDRPRQILTPTSITSSLARSSSPSALVHPESGVHFDLAELNNPVDRPILDHGADSVNHPVSDVASRSDLDYSGTGILTVSSPSLTTTRDSVQPVPPAGSNPLGGATSLSAPTRFAPRAFPHPSFGPWPIEGYQSMPHRGHSPTMLASQQRFPMHPWPLFVTDSRGFIVGQLPASGFPAHHPASSYSALQPPTHPVVTSLTSSHEPPTHLPTVQADAHDQPATMPPGTSAAAILQPHTLSQVQSTLAVQQLASATQLPSYSHTAPSTAQPSLTTQHAMVQSCDQLPVGDAQRLHQPGTDVAPVPVTGTLQPGVTHQPMHRVPVQPASFRSGQTGAGTVGASAGQETVIGDLSSMSFEFRAKRIPNFKVGDDDPADWLRVFEFFGLLRSTSPDYGFAVTALMFFLPVSQHDKIMAMIPRHTSWQSFRTDFVNTFTSKAFSYRKLTDVSRISQGPTESIPILRDRTLMLYKKAGVAVDPNLLKVQLRSIVRPELRHTLMENYHLPLSELWEVLERKEIALAEEPTMSGAKPASQYSATNQLTSPTTTSGQEPGSLSDQVDHTVNNVDSREEHRICYNCRQRGHISRNCQPRPRDESQHKSDRDRRHSDDGYRHRSSDRTGTSRDQPKGQDKRTSSYTGYDSHHRRDSPSDRRRRHAHSPDRRSRRDPSPDRRDRLRDSRGREEHDDRAREQRRDSKSRKVVPLKTFTVTQRPGLLRVHTCINGHWVNALIDTGASVSIFNVRVSAIRVDPTLCDGDIYIALATQNTKVRALGFAMVNVQLGNLSPKQHKFLLTDKINEDAILGLDFLEAHGLSIHPGDRILTHVSEQETVQCNNLSVRRRLPPTLEEQYMFATEDTLIRPSSTGYVPIVSASRLQAGMYILKDDQSNNQRSTQVAEVLFEVTEASVTMYSCPVLNSSSRPVMIRAGERMAKAEHVQEIVIQTATTETDTEQAQANIQHSLEHLSPDVRLQVERVLINNCQVFHVKGQKLRATDLTIHHIQLRPNADPVYTPQYPLSQAQQENAKRLILEMLRDKIIEPTRSEYNSPVILVRKANGEIRFVTDFRRLNEITVPDRFPMARQDDIFRDLQGMKYFTTIDLKSGFWQIEIDPSDRHFTAFSVAGIGQFQYCRLPFGLSNSPATFCRVVSTAISGLNNLMREGRRASVAHAYVDDLIIASADLDAHLEHINTILQALNSAKLTVNPSKCTWVQRSIKFLGHIVSGDGVSLDPARVRRIADWVIPRNRKAVLRFLGFVNYCRQFVPNFSVLCKPLYELVKKNKRHFDWRPHHQQAFESIKHALQQARKLAAPIYDGRPFFVSCDASDAGIGGILEQQQDDGTMQPIAFCGRNLASNEKLFGISEKECLGLVYSLQQFRLYTEGHEVIVRTDHSALTWLRTKPRLNNRRLQLWALTLQPFMPDIQYVPGPDMVVPDALSRCTQVDDPEEYLADSALCSIMQEVNTVTIVQHDYADSPQHSTTYVANTVTKVQQDLAQAQKADPVLGPVVAYLADATLPEGKVQQNRVKQQAMAYTLKDGLLTKSSKLVIPKALRQQYVTEAHDSPLGGHMGEYKTLDRLRQHYQWNGMARDVRAHVQSCASCGLKKPKTGVSKPTLMTTLPQPYQPFSEVNVDIVTSLPTSARGNNCIFVIVDKMSRWVEAYPLPDSTAPTLARVFFAEFVTRFGCPLKMSSDRGSNFTSEFFRTFLEAINVQQRLSPAYSPWVNGAVERMNGSIIRMLRNYVDDTQTNWDDMIPYVLFAYRATATRMTGYAPFQLVFGANARMPSIASLITTAAPSHLGRLTDVETYVKALSGALQKSWTHAATADTVYRTQTAREDPKLASPARSPVSAPDQEAPAPVCRQRAPAFKEGDEVWVYQPSRPAGSSKFVEDFVPGFKVTKVLSPHRLLVQRRDGQGRWDVREVHVDRVKPFVGRTLNERPEPKQPVSTDRRRPRGSGSTRDEAKIADKIVDMTYDDSGQTWYQVRWRGCSEQEDSLVTEKFFLSGGTRNPLLTQWLRKHDML